MFQPGVLWHVARGSKHALLGLLDFACVCPLIGVPWGAAVAITPGRLNSMTRWTQLNPPAIARSLQAPTTWRSTWMCTTTPSSRARPSTVRPWLWGSGASIGNKLGTLSSLQPGVKNVLCEQLDNGKPVCIEALVGESLTVQGGRFRSAAQLSASGLGSIAFVKGVGAVLQQQQMQRACQPFLASACLPSCRRLHPPLGARGV